MEDRKIFEDAKNKLNMILDSYIVLEEEVGLLQKEKDISYWTNTNRPEIAKLAEQMKELTVKEIEKLEEITKYQLIRYLPFDKESIEIYTKTLIKELSIIAEITDKELKENINSIEKHILTLETNVVKELLEIELDLSKYGIKNLLNMVKVIKKHEMIEFFENILKMIENLKENSEEQKDFINQINKCENKGCVSKVISSFFNERSIGNKMKVAEDTGNILYKGATQGKADLALLFTGDMAPGTFKMSYEEITSSMSHTWEGFQALVHPANYALALYKLNEYSKILLKENKIMTLQEANDFFTKELKQNYKHDINNILMEEKIPLNNMEILGYFSSKNIQMSNDRNIGKDLIEYYKKNYQSTEEDELLRNQEILEELEKISSTLFLMAQFYEYLEYYIVKDSREIKKDEKEKIMYYILNLIDRSQVTVNIEKGRKYKKISVNPQLLVSPYKEDIEIEKMYQDNLAFVDMNGIDISLLEDLLESEGAVNSQGIFKDLELFLSALLDNKESLTKISKGRRKILESSLSFISTTGILPIQATKLASELRLRQVYTIEAWEKDINKMSEEKDKMSEEKDKMSEEKDKMSEEKDDKTLDRNINKKQKLIDIFEYTEEDNYTYNTILKAVNGYIIYHKIDIEKIGEFNEEIQSLEINTDNFNKVKKDIKEANIYLLEVKEGLENILGNNLSIEVQTILMNTIINSFEKDTLNEEEIIKKLSNELNDKTLNMKKGKQRDDLIRELMLFIKNIYGKNINTEVKTILKSTNQKKDDKKEETKDITGKK